MVSSRTQENWLQVTEGRVIKSLSIHSGDPGIQVGTQVGTQVTEAMGASFKRLGSRAYQTLSILSLMTTVTKLRTLSSV